MQRQSGYRRRMITIGVLCALGAVLFLAVFPRTLTATCHSWQIDSIDAAGRNVRTGHVACLPEYWFCICAFLGASLAAFLTLKKVTLLRSIGFVIVCDVLMNWFGVMAMLVVWKMADPTMPLVEFPWLAVLVGLTFGNLATKGFALWAGMLALLITLGLDAAVGTQAAQ